ncbi:MAG: hypothetical protein U0H95_01540 [Lachnospira sp.]|nr:hypothetical protein [Lachnospira sp.]
MADNELDSLKLTIKANATDANNALDKLVENLKNLSSSLGVINNVNFSNFSNGVKNITDAMQGMKNVSKADFTRLSEGMKKISSIDTAAINKASTAMTYLGKSFNSMQATSEATKQITELVTGIKQLGYASAAKAIDNIPKLSSAMKQLMQELSKAPQVSQNLIDMTNALANLSRTGASSGRAATSLSKNFLNVSSSANSATKSSWSLASAFGKLYASYWLVFRGISKLGDSIDIASSLIEVENVVRTTFGNYENLVDSMAKTSIRDFGMSELSVKQYSSRFQAMGVAMGFSQKKMADMSIELTKLTADMASFYDMEQSDVARNLQAIFTGETEPLRKYGLDLTQATLKEWALKNGLDANISSMTQAEKTMLRYKYVMANTVAAQGDFAKTADTWHNQTVILKQSFQELAGIIGTSLINAFKPFLSGLNFAMTQVINFAETVTNALGAIFGWKFEVTNKGIADDWSDAADSADDIADSTGNAAKNVEKLNKGVRQFDELKLITTPDSSSGNGKKGSGTGAASADGASGGLVKVDTIWKDYKSQIKNLRELGEYIGNTLTDTLNSIDWDSVYAGARNFGKGLADFLNGLISPKLFGAVGRTIAGALNTAVYTALSFGETLDWENLGFSIATGINQFFETFDFASTAKAINKWVQGIYDTIKTAIKNIKWSKVLEGIATLIGDVELKTVAIIIGAVLLKKYFKLEIAKNILKGIATSISQSIAKSLAAKMGVEIAQNAGISKALTAGIKKSIGNIDYGGLSKTLSSLMSTKLKATIGIAGIATEFLTVATVFEKIGEGANFTVGMLAKVAAGAGVAAAALKLIGLSTPWTAAIVGITGVVAAIAGIGIGAAKAEKEIKDSSINISDTVKQTAENLNSTIQSSKDQLNSVGDTYADVKSVADKYFELADNFDNLTDSQKEMLIAYANYIVEQCPELADSIDTVTGEFKGQKDEVYNTISALEAYAKAAAMQDVLKDLYKQQFDIGNQLKENNEKINKADEIIYDYVKNLTGMSRQAFNSTYEISGLGDAFDVLTEILDKTKERTNGFKKTSEDLRNELGLNRKEVHELTNNSVILENSYAKATNAIDDAATEAAVCRNEYNKLTQQQNDTADSSDNLRDTMQQNNEQIRESVQQSMYDIEKNVAEKSGESTEDISNFYNKASETFGRLGVVGTDGGTKLYNGFTTTTSGLPGYNSAIFDNIQQTAISKALDTGSKAGENLVDTYKKNIDGVPNTTAVAFLSIIDAVNAGEIGSDVGADLMNNLADTISSKAWKVHDALTNAIQNSYKMELESDDNYSAGDPLKSGFAKIRIKGYADGGYLPQKYSIVMAGENGIPEIAGTVGGKSAVAGGAEITGIKDSIYDTSQREIALLRQQNQLLQGILNKDLSISQNDIGSSARKYAREYFKRTGKPAFDY